MDKLLDQYLAILLEVNAHTNLTAIRDPEEIRVRHFEDSQNLLKAADFANKTVLDVGSGAGFPGLVLKIAQPSISLSLLDATGKKVRFLRRVCDELGLEGVTCLHGRAEDFMAEARRRKCPADLLLSRAFLPWQKVLALAGENLAPRGLVLCFAQKEPPQSPPPPWRLLGARRYSPSAASPEKPRWFWVFELKPAPGNA